MGDKCGVEWRGGKGRREEVPVVLFGNLGLVETGCASLISVSTYLTLHSIMMISVVGLIDRRLSDARLAWEKYQNHHNPFFNMHETPA